MAGGISNLIFNILVNDRASRPLHELNKRVNESVGATDRHSAALRKHNSAALQASAGMLAVGHSFAGTDSILKMVGRDTSIVGRAWAGLTAATSIAESSIAALTITLGGLASGVGAASIGVGAYGLALVPLIQKTGEFMKLQEQAASGNKKAAEELKKFPPVIGQFAGEVTKAKDTYEKWSLSLAKPVLEPFRHALSLTGPVLRALTPLVEEAAAGIGDLVDKMAQNIEGGGLERWVREVAPLVRPMIVGIGTAIGNVIGGLGNIARAFAQFAPGVMTGLDNITQKFQDWSANLTQHSGFQAMREMWQANWPYVKQALGDMLQILGNVVRAMASMASPGNTRVLWDLANPLLAMGKAVSSNPQLLQAFMYILLIAKAGRSLAGVATSIMAIVGSVTGAGFAGGVTNLGKMVLGIGGAGAAAKVAGPAVGGAATATSALGGAAGAAWGPIGLVAAATVGLGIATGIGLYNALNNSKRAFQEAAAAAANTDAYYRKLSGAVGWNIQGYQQWDTRMAVAEGEMARQATSLGMVTTQHGKLTIATHADTQEQWLAVAGYGASIGAHQRATTETQRLVGFVDLMRNSYQLTTPQVYAMATAAGVQARDIANGNLTVDEAKRKMDAYAQSIQGVTDKLNAAVDPHVKMSQNVINLKNDEWNLKAALDASGGAIGYETREQINSQQAFDTMIGDVKDLYLNLIQQGTSTTDAKDRTVPYVEWLWRAAGGNTEDRIRVEELCNAIGILYPGALNKVPGAIHTAIGVTASGHWDEQTLQAISTGRGMLRAPNYATGGRIPGFGGGDRIPILAERGEAVVDKQTTRAHAGTLAAWGVPGFQRGGFIDHPIGVRADPDLVAAQKVIDMGKAANPYDFRQKDKVESIIAQYTAWQMMDIVQGLAAMGGRGMADAAEKFLGHRYVWGGGANPVTGFDCSSFVNMIAGMTHKPIPGGFKAPSAQHGPSTLGWLGFNTMQRIGIGSMARDDLYVNRSHMGVVTGKGRGFAARSTATGTGPQSVGGNYTILRFPGFGPGLFPASTVLVGWAQAVLSQLGANVGGAVDALVHWALMEGGHFHNAAKYNPLNTTILGFGGTSINRNGIKAFPNWVQGIAATAATLRIPYYGGILAALRSGDYNRIGRAVLASRWGTTRWAQGGLVNAFDNGGALPPGLSLAWNGTGDYEDVVPRGKRTRANREVLTELRMQNALLKDLLRATGRVAPDTAAGVAGALGQAGKQAAYSSMYSARR